MTQVHEAAPRNVGKHLASPDRATSQREVDHPNQGDHAPRQESGCARAQSLIEARHERERDARREEEGGEETRAQGADAPRVSRSSPGGERRRRNHAPIIDIDGLTLGGGVPKTPRPSSRGPRWIEGSSTRPSPRA